MTRFASVKITKSHTLIIIFISTKSDITSGLKKEEKQQSVQMFNELDAFYNQIMRIE